MTCRITVLFFAILLGLFSCRYDNITPSDTATQGAAEKEKKSNDSIDYLVFGHTNSFCLICDAIYKIEGGKLYGSRHQRISDPDNVQLSLLPDSSYQKVKNLITEIPAELLNGSTSSVQSIGSFFPDVGHDYVEISRNRIVYRWYIEADNTPTYLTDFLKDLNQAIATLR